MFVAAGKNGVAPNSGLFDLARPCRRRCRTFIAERSSAFDFLTWNQMVGTARRSVAQGPELGQ
ncbi:hypothetical protein GCM10009828_011970 [Actinoplanes couchii]|uniref:Uncharacterized protein n=1 Tax=Actinoplanes couchii TaxID=403638 RepID=A0ABQ3XJ30_9ACTN|nr:hypothetical protein Aco03nite_069080 [Actinoplanes couchii]